MAAVARPGSRGGGSGERPIALFDAATGNRVRELTTGADLDPAFSPDAKRLAFVRGRDLYTVSAGGGSRAAAGQERVQPVLGAALIDA